MMDEEEVVTQDSLVNMKQKQTSTKINLANQKPFLYNIAESSIEREIP